MEGCIKYVVWHTERWRDCKDIGTVKFLASWIEVGNKTSKCLFLFLWLSADRLQGGIWASAWMTCGDGRAISVTLGSDPGHEHRAKSPITCIHVENRYRWQPGVPDLHRRDFSICWFPQKKKRKKAHNLWVELGESHLKHITSAIAQRNDINGTKKLRKRPIINHVQRNIWSRTRLTFRLSGAAVVGRVIGVPWRMSQGNCCSSGSCRFKINFAQNKTA